MTIALKVVGVYIVVVIGSLALDGVMANRAIQHYVIESTRANLMAQGERLIREFSGPGDARSSTSGAGTAAVSGVVNQYIVVAPSGEILQSTFTGTDARFLSQIGNVVGQALSGKPAVGVYPQGDPVFEFVALPFMSKEGLPAQVGGTGPLRTVPLPYLTARPQVNARVVALFARVSDIRRISSQIWMTVWQGLAIASLITALVGVALTRGLMRPFGQLRMAIDRVRERDFSTPPAVKTKDEWKDLSDAFAAMMNDLRFYDEAQKRFLQNASHELKTPLMAIRGYAEGLRDGVFEPSESFRILDIIAQESVRLKSLVDELIYLSKLETLDDVYAFIQQDLVSILYRTIERLHPLAREREIQVLVDVPDAPLNILADRDKMVQALMNLGSNAIRHARRQVFIRLQGGEEITIVVEDDGEGFREQDLERVFERFFHGSKGDTGLGLPIARAIVEKHRGQIVAENTAEHGARFIVRLPRQ